MTRVRTRFFDAGMQRIVGELAHYEAVSGLRFTYVGRCTPTGSDSTGPIFTTDVRIMPVPGGINANWPDYNRPLNHDFPGCATANRRTNCPSATPGAVGTCTATGYTPARSGGVDVSDCSIPLNFLTCSSQSWSSGPDNNFQTQYCPANVFLELGDVPPHPEAPLADGASDGASTLVLHEVGHRLGMIHEFARIDQSNCTELPSWAGYGITAIDDYSIMYYWNGTQPCYKGQGNLSALDALGMEIAYPPSSSVLLRPEMGVAFNGAWATFSTGPVMADWRSRGAVAGVFGRAAWTAGSTTRSGIDAMNTSVLPSGVKTVRLSFTDPWGRARSGTADVSIAPEQATSVVASANGVLM